MNVHFPFPFLPAPIDICHAVQWQLIENASDLLTQLVNVSVDRENFRLTRQLNVTE